MYDMVTFVTGNSIENCFEAKIEDILAQVCSYVVLSTVSPEGPFCNVCCVCTSEMPNPNHLAVYGRLGHNERSWQSSWSGT